VAFPVPLPAGNATGVEHAVTIDELWRELAKHPSDWQVNAQTDEGSFEITDVFSTGKLVVLQIATTGI
jgi:hypothetical protein